MKNQKALKKLLWLIALIALVGIYTEHSVLKPVQANAPYARENNTFPMAGDRKLSIPEQIRQIVRKHNFKWEDYLVKLADCEGLMDSYQNNTFGNYPVGSIDRGLYGINDYWHSEVSNECAYDVKCSTEWSMKRINDGYQHEWYCDPIIRDKNYRWRS